MDPVSARFQHTNLGGPNPLHKRTNSNIQPTQRRVVQSILKYFGDENMFWGGIVGLEDLLKFLEQSTLIHQHYEYPNSNKVSIWIPEAS